MMRLRLLDESPLVAVRFGSACEASGWVLLDEDSSEVPDALVIDPAWRNHEGLRLLHRFRTRLEEEPLPVIALVSQANASLEALLFLLRIPFAVKTQFNPEELLEQLAQLAEMPGVLRKDWERAFESDGNVASAFEERILAHALLSIMAGAPSAAGARVAIRAYLAETFSLDQPEVEQSFTDGKVAFRDHRVAFLYERALDLVVPFFRILDEIERDEGQVDQIHRVFRRFLPGEVITDLLRRSGDAAPSPGEKRQVAALFSHIKSFGFYIEENDPRVLVEFLNRHFQLYSAIVRKHGGFINKYIGDAVFALFGAPVSYVDNARRALEAAKEINTELEGFRKPGVVLPAEGYHVGFGLNEGLAIVGNIGATDSFDYTAIGDAINLAARLESLNAHYETTFLMSDTFASGLSLEGGPEVLRTVDRVKVVGKREATTIYTVITAPEAPEGRRFLDLYEKALKMVRIGNWLTARELLDEALALRPGDSLCTLHRERVARYEIEPPQDWDGAVELGFK